MKTLATMLALIPSIIAFVFAIAIYGLAPGASMNMTQERGWRWWLLEVLIFGIFSCLLLVFIGMALYVAVVSR